MLLSKKEKEEIRNVRNGWFYAIDEKGAPKYPNDIEEKPNYEVDEIRKQIIEILQQMNYKVYSVNSPKFANCIIRVYKSEQNYDNEKYRILGGQCYTRTLKGKWKCLDWMGDEYNIDFSGTGYVDNAMFYQDDHWDLSVDFVDMYVKLVKEK